MNKRALAAVVLLAACGPPADAPTGLVLITLDTTRADHLSVYGHPLPLTPRLDALAADGLRFERAYAPMPQTLPSHATLFTGLEPREHHATENYRTLPAGVETLAERLAARGWETAAFVGSLALDARTGIAQGFSVFDQPDEAPETDAWHPPERPAQDVTDAALAWARQRDATAPFFLWVHYYDPHGPYAPPDDVDVPVGPLVELVEAHAEFAPLPQRARAERVETWRAYAGEVAHVDREVGRLLDGLDDAGLLGRAAIAAIGDHGEGLFEHGEKGHGVNVYEELMRVPAIVVGPGWPEGVVAEPVPLSDLGRLLETLAGAPPASNGLAERLLAGRPPAPRPVFVERPHYSEERAIWRAIPEARRGFLVGVIQGDWKAVRAPDGALALFDLSRDPEEVTDVSAGRPELAERLSALIAEFEARSPAEAPARDDVDPDRRRQLEQLGYN